MQPCTTIQSLKHPRVHFGSCCRSRKHHQKSNPDIAKPMATPCLRARGATACCCGGACAAVSRGSCSSSNSSGKNCRASACSCVSAREGAAWLLAGCVAAGARGAAYRPPGCWLFGCAAASPPPPARLGNCSSACVARYHSNLRKLKLRFNYCILLVALVANVIEDTVLRATKQHEAAISHTACGS